MATHDYIISNASGAAVRADLNNALAAIATNNSSATEPTTTYAYQWWADTGSSPTVMKLRNAANSGWITLFQLDGEWTVVPFENGTAAAPSIYFKDSGTDTGIYSPGTDQVGISAGGTSRFEVSTSATTSTLPVVHPLGAVGTPSITFTGDLNTGIWSPAADTVAVSTNGTRAITIDSSQRLGIGTASPTQNLHVVGAATTNPAILLAETSGSSLQIISGASDSFIGTNGSTPLRLGTAFTERARIDSSGRLLVGTSTARANFYNGSDSGQIQLEGTTYQNTTSALICNSSTTGNTGTFLFAKSAGTSIGSNTAVTSGHTLGVLSFQGNDGSEFVEAASIVAQVDGTPGADDMPGRLVFSTTADGASSPTERMRINNAGNLNIGRTSDLAVTPRISVECANFGIAINTTNGGANEAMRFYNAGTAVGTITTTGSATAYNTSSDYRLKENVVPVDDGITRLQQLKPSRFNFIIDPDTTVDGFIAHEVQAVVPEAITGEKDAEDEDGNPIYQGIDQSKLVPLLTAALQEAIGEIEKLKARVVALESKP